MNRYCARNNQYAKKKNKRRVFGFRKKKKKISSALTLAHKPLYLSDLLEVFLS